MSDDRTARAAELMARFAERTGLSSDRVSHRYLWTDAFAVCNYLGLARITSDERFGRRALELVDQVHHTLGRHRADDPRTGWLSGLTGDQAEAHPTRGGLRIGKKRPERSADEPFDPRLEWDREGQYFHYLTKWMHALDLVARHTGEPRFNRWAHELAESAHRAFVYHPAGSPPRMYWKMSIDLSRPLVPSMGHHDPLDGLVSGRQLMATASTLPGDAEPDLGGEIADYAAMIRGQQLTTDDPLGLGGLLMDARRVQQLVEHGKLDDTELLERLLTAALRGIEQYAAGADLDRPARARLAFRELGLAIGLQGMAPMGQAIKRSPARYGRSAIDRLDALARYLPLAERITSFWLDPSNRKVATFTEHLDINEVMLATSLVPEGCLSLPEPSSGH